MQDNISENINSNESPSDLAYVNRSGNRNLANKLLAVIFVLFLAALIFKFYYKDSFIAGLLAFTAESAFVGGIADWFAVTALFKKPLGFSWHTAIIPRNREKIIDKITRMVGEELLSVDSIRKMLAGLNITGILADRLLDTVGSEELAEQLQNLMSENSSRLDRSKIASDMEALIKENLKKENMAEEIRKLLLKAFEEGKHAGWLSYLLDKARDIAVKDSTREKIYRILKEQEQNARGTTAGGAFFAKALLDMAHGSRHMNLISISGLLQQELTEVLLKLNDPQGHLFGKLAAALYTQVRELDESGTLIHIIQSWKNGILDRLELHEALELVLSSATESRMNMAEAASIIAGHLESYKKDLKNDDETRIWMDGILKDMLDKIIRSEHHIIGETVKETLEAFTNERLNKFIDEKVGDDLQWIRINGSIVGASAGALIYLFVNLVYSPYIVPMIRNLFGM